MLPSFGVGLRNFLFENFNSEVANKIERESYSQVKKYMPFINLKEITFTTRDELPTLPLNMLRMEIVYSISNFGVSDTIVVDTKLIGGVV